MCNCGKKQIKTTPAYNTSKVNQQQQMNTAQQAIRFQYTGTTALTAIGNITGRSYRFNRPNDIQLIDKRDATAMRQIPVLKQV